jgi:hypothetical protein
VIRGQKVMLDADLADVYGVTTRRLNEQVKRNRKRFPADFMFLLNDRERAEVVANCDHLVRLKFSPVPPYAFTEHGAIMAASVLNSPRAVEMSVYVVRAFMPCATSRVPMLRSPSNSAPSNAALRGTTKRCTGSCRPCVGFSLPAKPRRPIGVASKGKL